MKKTLIKVSVIGLLALAVFGVQSLFQPKPQREFKPIVVPVETVRIFSLFDECKDNQNHLIQCVKKPEWPTNEGVIK